MKQKYTGKYDFLLETALVRFQQGGFLTGDSVKIKKSALNNPKIKDMPEQFKERLKAFMDEDLTLRVSAVKSQRANTALGTVGGADAPTDYYVDIVQEISPANWVNPMTVPMEIIEKEDYDHLTHTAPISDKLKRKSKIDMGSDDIGADSYSRMSKELDLPKKNTKLSNSNKWDDKKPGAGNTKSLKKLINASYDLKKNGSNYLVEQDDPQRITFDGEFTPFGEQSPGWLSNSEIEMVLDVTEQIASDRGTTSNDEKDALANNILELFSGAKENGYDLLGPYNKPEFREAILQYALERWLNNNPVPKYNRLRNLADTSEIKKFKDNLGKYLEIYPIDDPTIFPTIQKAWLDAHESQVSKLRELALDYSDDLEPYMQTGAAAPGTDKPSESMPSTTQVQRNSPLPPPWVPPPQPNKDRDPIIQGGAAPKADKDIIPPPPAPIRPPEIKPGKIPDAIPNEKPPESETEEVKGEIPQNIERRLDNNEKDDLAELARELDELDPETREIVLWAVKERFGSDVRDWLEFISPGSSVGGPGQGTQQQSGDMGSGGMGSNGQGNGGVGLSGFGDSGIGDGGKGDSDRGNGPRKAPAPNDDYEPVEAPPPPQRDIDTRQQSVSFRNPGRLSGEAVKQILSDLFGLDGQLNGLDPRPLTMFNLAEELNRQLSVDMDEAQYYEDAVRTYAENNILGGIKANPRGYFSGGQESRNRAFSQDQTAPWDRTYQGNAGMQPSTNIDRIMDGQNAATYNRYNSNAARDEYRAREQDLRWQREENRRRAEEERLRQQAERMKNQRDAAIGQGWDFNVGYTPGKGWGGSLGTGSGSRGRGR